MVICETPWCVPRGDLLDEQGINALSLRAVARGAGVSSAAPYRHFPDKASLLAAVAADGFRDLSRCMAEAADAAAPSTPPADRFKALGLGYIRFGLDNPAVLRLMFGAEIECKDDYPELAETARNAFATLADTTESLVGGAGQRARSGALAALVPRAWPVEPAHRRPDQVPNRVRTATR